MERQSRAWLLSRRDVANGAGVLLKIQHPLLPEITAARPTPDGVLLGPPVRLPDPLRPDLGREGRAGFLVRLLGLAAFLEFHGLGIAGEDVPALGGRPGDPLRPWLAAPPVPLWRAIPPPLLAAAAAARLMSADVAGSTPSALGRSVGRSLERSRSGDAAGDVVSCLRCHEGGLRSEVLLAELANRAELPGGIGADLLGLSYPSSFAASLRGRGPAAASGPGALWTVRGAARRPGEAFVEIPPASPLREGSGLLRVARELDGDPRAEGLRRLARGDPAPFEGPPLTLVVREPRSWDPRSRAALERELSGPAVARFEVWGTPPRAWEEREILEPLLTVAEISALLWLPFLSLAEAVEAWEAVAAAAGGDAGLFLDAVHRFASRFRPSGRRPRSGSLLGSGRAPRDPVLQAAALLGDEFPVSEAAAAAGVDPERAATALGDAVRRGLLVAAERERFRFQDEAERRRLAGQLSNETRRDVVSRLAAGSLEGDRLLIASLAVGEAADVVAARERLGKAAAEGDRQTALALISRAPDSAPDLGAPWLAFRLLADSGRTEAARLAARRLDPAHTGAVPAAERLAVGRQLVRIGEAERALALFPQPRDPEGTLAVAWLLLEARREGEVADLLGAAKLPAAALSHGQRGELALLLAEVAERRGDYARGGALLGEARELLYAEPDHPALFDSLRTAGILANDLGRPAEAMTLFRRARDAASDDERRADAALDLSVSAFLAGETDECERSLQEALRFFAELGDEARYVSALGNRVDLLMHLGDFTAARSLLARVLAFDRQPGREHQFLFTVYALQELCLLEGDVARAETAFREAEERLAAKPGHPAWRRILVREGARRLTVGQAAAALECLAAAGELPDSRLGDEPRRLRLLLSASLDLGRPLPDPLPAGLGAGEEILLRSEVVLGQGRGVPARLLRELSRRLESGRGAVEVTVRVLEWMGRFPDLFVSGSGEEVAALGLKAALRAGLQEAAELIERRMRALAREPAGPPSAASPLAESPSHVAEDVSTRDVFAVVAKVARTSLPLLIRGESGTGKEVVAREAHRLSGRAGPFLAVNVAALTETLAESELFGHVRGAFTGADRDRAGVIEASSGGTLFLDEIGDLPLSVQAKLLQALQEGEVRRVGETRTRRVDLRVMCATHRDLPAMVLQGTFRRDLYHRIAGAEVTLAPLRERPRDLLRFVEIGLAGATLTQEARERVLVFSWPGNVRELLAALESARALAAPGRVVGLEHLPASLLPRSGHTGRRTYFDHVAQAKREAILGALRVSGGNRSRAADLLGLSRQSLLYEIRKLKIKP